MNIAVDSVYHPETRESTMSQLQPKSGILQIRPHMLSSVSSDHPPPRVLLDSNESAFGPSPAARAAAAAAVAGLERYLENPARLLAPAIARRHGLEAERIAVGTGSDDLLARLARIYLEPGSEMIRSRNGYLKTPNYAHANNATPVAVDDDAFTTSVDAILEAVGERTRMVYVANPENPAGTHLGSSEISRLHRGLPRHVLLVLDCAYAEYADAEDYDPGHALACEADNVVVTRTFSKLYGLAGARVGWLHANPEIVDLVNRIGLTFPLATPSVAAALAALEDDAHLRRVRGINRRLRESFAAQMRNLGLRVYSSQTNFVLVEFAPGERSAARCAEALARQGIAVRRFASPAYENCLRVTIGFEADMQLAAGRIAAFLGASE